MHFAILEINFHSNVLSFCAYMVKKTRILDILSQVLSFYVFGHRVCNYEPTFMHFEKKSCHLLYIVKAYGSEIRTLHKMKRNKLYLPFVVGHYNCFVVVFLGCWSRSKSFNEWNKVRYLMDSIWNWPCKTCYLAFC